MGFLLLAWYDGREYKQRLMSALKDMRKLEGNHAEDIYFLDEINKRCCYLDHEYGKIVDGVFEQLNDILKISDTYQLLHSAFFFHFGNERELICLEMGLISDCAGKFSDTSLFIDLGDGLFSRSVLRFGAYADMKLPFLSENEQRTLLKEFLDAARKECAGVGYSEEHRLAIDVLIGKLGPVATVDVKSPIMNFQFVRNNEKTDFSDEPFVKDFLSYKNVPEKRKWLQKCLLQGLPIFTYISFDKLGFEVRNIL
jgi:hypothetical protein